MLRKFAMLFVMIGVAVLFVLFVDDTRIEGVQLPEENSYPIMLNEARHTENIDEYLHQEPFSVSHIAYMAENSNLYSSEAENRVVLMNRDLPELTNFRYLSSSTENESENRELITEILSEVSDEGVSSELEVPLWRTLPYLIYVSLDSFTIAILGLDENGYHTELLHTWHTAYGRTNAQTRPGTYEILSKSTWISWGNGWFSPYGSRYVGGLWFHGPLYRGRNLNGMRASSFNQIGTRATSGCFRTSTNAASWIYHNAPIGTRVIVANDSFFTSPVPDRIPQGQTFDPTYPLYITPRVDTSEIYISEIDYAINGRCG